MSQDDSAIDLDGAERQRLVDALLGAFDRDGLEQLTSFALDLPLDQVTRQGTLANVALELVIWGEQNNRLRQMMVWAKSQRPANDELVEIVNELLQKPAEPPGPVSLTRVPSDAGTDLCRSDVTAGDHQTSPTLQNVIPFTVTAEKAQETCRAWMGSEFVHPRDLKKTAKIAAPTGVFLPAWLWRAHATSTWRAMAVYLERRERTIQQQPVPGTVPPPPPATEVEVIRHAPVQVNGDHEGSYPNIWVLAFARPSWLREVWPTPQGYDLSQLVVYDPALVAGYKAEPPTSNREAARQSACQQIKELEATASKALIPGDEVEDPVVKTRVDTLQDTLVHLPVWRLTYQYGVKPYQCLVNGQSGAAVCDGPTDTTRSMLPILIFVVVCLVIFIAYVSGLWRVLN